jgi:hypothetical protein
VNVVVVLVTIVLLAAVIAVISSPLRAARSPRSADSAERAEFEAEREAKYREIRDAELDYRTGKLSEEDYRAVDGALRAEAVEILRKLDALQEREGKDGAQ